MTIQYTYKIIFQSRYSGKFTPLAKTLQEDSSCQLCTIMQKFVLEETTDKIEKGLKQQYLPQLGTLREGVIVLSRQWKNVLYNPMLFEHQYKGKLVRPINVAFSIPQLDEVCFRILIIIHIILKIIPQTQNREIKLNYYNFFDFEYYFKIH